MLHRAKVVDNRPNDAQWRMTVQVPGLYSDSPVEAWPMLISNTLQERPDNGAGVWVMEADGDLVVWMGQWATAGMDVDALLDAGHDQYLTNAKHDITARHIFGAALGTPSAPPDIATAGAAGSGASPSRSDHTHKVGSGAINNSAMFAAGVVNTAALSNSGPGATSAGSASSAPVLTIDAKGRVTALSTATITPAAIGAPSGSGTHSGTSSGNNTGDQNLAITLTGVVTGSGTGTINTAFSGSGIVDRPRAPNATLNARSGGSVNGGVTTLIIQAGTSTGTTNGSGDLTIGYPSSLSGLVCFIPTNGDPVTAPGGYITVLTPGTGSTTVRCYNSGGGARASALTVVDWILIGW